MKTIDKKNVKTILPLTYLQNSIFVNSIGKKNKGLYIEQTKLKLSGVINEDIFKNTWQIIFDKYDALRTIFRWEKLKNPIQIILKKCIPEIIILDYCNYSDINGQIEKLRKNILINGLDIERQSLKIYLIKENSHSYTLLVINHHILTDGWSLGIILNEFNNIYESLTNNISFSISQSNDYCEQIKKIIDVNNLIHSDYWINYLSEISNTQAGSKTLRSNNKEIVSIDFEIGSRLEKEIEVYVKKHKLTNHTLFSSVWGTLLQTINDVDDVIFYNTVSIRDRSIGKADNSVGLFINTVPQRLKFKKDITFNDLLNYAKHDLINRSDKTNVDLGKLFVDAKINIPQFDINSLFVFENYPVETVLKKSQKDNIKRNEFIAGNSINALSDNQIKPYGIPRLEIVDYQYYSQPDYDLTLIITDFDFYKHKLFYDKKLFGEDAINQIVEKYFYFLKVAIENPYDCISEYFDINIRNLIKKEITGQDKILLDKKTKYTEDHITNTLVELWSEIFDIDIDKVSDEINYFEYYNFSLKTVHLVNRIRQLLNIDISITEVLECTTISKLAPLIRQKRVTENRALLTFSERKEHYCLSQEQLRLYYMHIVHENSTQFNAPKLFAINKKLSTDDIRYLNIIVNKIIHRHQGLRTIFKEINGEVRQVVLPASSCSTEINIEYLGYLTKLDLYHAISEDKSFKGNADKLSSLFNTYTKSFELSKFPLFRIWILQLHDESNFILIDIHHIISDGVSMYILIDEIKKMVNSLVIKPVNYYYTDYADWQLYKFLPNHVSNEINYWKNMFAKIYSPLDLPFDFEVSSSEILKGNKLYWSIEKEKYNRLLKILENNRLTLYAFFLSAYYLLLFKWLRRQDIVIGIVASKRNDKQLENLVGLLIDSYPIRIDLGAGANVSDLISIVKERLSEIYRNKGIPYHEILKIVAANDHKLKNSLINVMLNIHDYVDNEFYVNNIEISEIDFYYELPKTDISVDIMKYKETLKYGIEYNCQLFKEETILNLGNEFANIIDRLINIFEAEKYDLDLSFIFDKESQHILPKNKPSIKFNDTDFQFLEEFEMHVKQNPGKVALIFENKTDNYKTEKFTYQQVDDYSNRIANYLIDNGISNNIIIGLFIENGINRIISILGVLKSKAAFLPLDINIPKERVNYILKDSGISYIITDKELGEITGKIELLDYIKLTEYPGNRSLTLQRDANDLAYIIYTSGSTGQPKGVMVENKNMNNYIEAFLDEFMITSEDIFLQQASYSFDTYIEEVFPILSIGGGLAVIPENDKRDISYVASFIQRNKITIVDCSPLMLGQLNNIPDINLLNTVRIYISGGDVLKSTQINRLFYKGEVYNSYGPTETTVCVTYYKCETIDIENQPIGKSIKNYSIILSTASNSNNVSRMGEIMVVGNGVTRGYLNNPELTHEKYISLDEIQKIRKYKTGDIGKLRDDGNIEFVGRIDEQVKIRGYRVDLIEIEQKLKSFNKINDAIVTYHEDHDSRRILSAYIVKKTGETIVVPEIRSFLQESLAEYMVPHLYYEVDEIPFTSGDKPDRQTVKKHGRAITNILESDLQELSATEKTLFEIWQTLLKHDNFNNRSNFFEIGGDSILITKAITRIRNEFSIEISYKDFYKNPTIQEIAEIINNSVTIIDEKKLEKSEYHDEAPLSFSQERIWFLQQLYENNKSYNVTRALTFKGDLNIYIFQKAIDLIIEKHEIYRTVFRKNINTAYQKILPVVDCKVKRMSIDEIENKNEGINLEQWILKTGREIFDIENGPLIRFYLVQIKNNEYFFLVVEHHLIHDGWTQGLLLEEFVDIYKKLQENSSYRPKASKLQYADFAIWQKQYFSREVLQKQMAFWKKKFDVEVPDLKLPFDNQSSSFFDGKGELLVIEVPNNLEERLKQFAISNNTTLFVVMLAAFKIELYRYSQISQICVGTGVANRIDEKLESVLGMVINTIPILTHIKDGNILVKEFIALVKESYLDSFQYANTPFEKIVEAVKPERDLRKMPLFQVLFSFMDTPTKRFELPNIEITIENSHNQTAKFDINIVIVPTHSDNNKVNDSMLIEWEYNTDLFEKSTMHEMMNNYFQLLNIMVESSQLTISELPMHSESALKRLLYNKNEKFEPTDNGIISLFSNQVKNNKYKIALVSNDLQFSYEYLDTITSQYAKKLIKFGIQKGSIVAYLLDKDSDWIISTLAILKAGALYLPIENSLSKKQIQYILRDSEAQLVITKKQYSDLIDNFKNILFNDLLNQEVVSNLDVESIESRDLAYIMYTSGTTGNPKGVMVEHGSIVRLINNPNYVSLGNYTRLLQTGAQAFDASVFEIWGTLLNGGTLFLMNDNEMLDSELLKKSIETFDINIMWLTAPLFHQHCDVNINLFKPLKQLLVGGDVLQTNKVNLFLNKNPDVKLINGYGPTENTVFTTCYKINEESKHSVSIGYPINYTGVYVVDKNLQLLPRGAEGELITTGVGLSRGYLNRPELTNEKFVKIPFRNHELAYKTGDIVRWRSNDTLEFIGREDNQVKIRGNRVEIGSIEAHINNHCNVISVVVNVVEQNGNKALVAYILTNKKLFPENIKDYLREYLPKYMIPDYIIFVKHMPLNKNGKIDKDILYKEYQLPKYEHIEADDLNIQEKEIARIWSEILSVDINAIHKNSNFFDLGGHSLNAVILISKLRDSFEFDLSVVDIFKYPDLQNFSSCITKKTSVSRARKLEKTAEQEYYELSSPQKRLYWLLQLYNDSVVYNISKVVEIQNVVDVKHLNHAFSTLIMQHESLRTSFHQVNGDVKQKIHTEFNFEIVIKNTNESQVYEEIDKSIKPFDLSMYPLIRVNLLRVSENKNILVIDLPHIIADGVSINKLLEQFTTIYKYGEIVPAKYQYRDYIVWYEKWKTSNNYIEHKEFWKNIFSSPVLKLNLPTDFLTKNLSNCKGKNIYFTINQDTMLLIQNKLLAGDQTMFMFLLFNFFVLISKYSESDDLTIGCPVSGRTKHEFFDIMGLFANMLPIRFRLDNHIEFELLFKNFSQSVVKYYNYQDYQFDDIVNNYGFNTEKSNNPLFDIVFAYINNKGQENLLKQMNMHPIKFEKGTTPYHLLMNVFEFDNKIELVFEYATDLFMEDTIEEMYSNYLFIINQVIKNPQIKLKDIQLKFIGQQANTVLDNDSQDYLL